MIIVWYHPGVPYSMHSLRMDVSGSQPLLSRQYDKLILIYLFSKSHITFYWISYQMHWAIQQIHRLKSSLDLCRSICTNFGDYCGGLANTKLNHFGTNIEKSTKFNVDSFYNSACNTLIPAKTTWNLVYIFNSEILHTLLNYHYQCYESDLLCQN